MESEGARHTEPGRRYDVLIVPTAEGGKTRGFRVSRGKLWVFGALAVLFVSGLTFLVLVYSPLAVYVPIPNPRLEAKYGREILDTQRRLKSLADDVMILRDYNAQLRKILGEAGVVDSMGASDILASRRSESAAGEQERSVEQPPVVPAAAEVLDDLDPAGSHFNAVVTSGEGFRAAFPLIDPIHGFITRTFDPSRRHYGMDYAAKRGTPVQAAAEGYVVFAGWTSEDGNMLILSHGGGYLTVYKHNQSLLKSIRTFVRRGEQVALVGSTGRTSLGPHLHFEFWKDGVPLDPGEYLLTSPSLQ